VRFEVEGTIDGEPAGLVWEDGEVSGSAATAVLNRVRVDRESIGATQTGPFFAPSLEWPVVLYVIGDVFTTYELVGEDLPPFPSYGDDGPEGSVF